MAPLSLAAAALLAVLAGPLPAAPAAPAAAGDTLVSTAFVGFAADGSHGVVQQSWEHRAADRSAFSVSVVAVVDVADGHVQQMFRAGPIGHRAAGGGRLAAAGAPRAWRQLPPPAAWQRYRAAARLQCVPLKFKDSLLRLQLEAGGGAAVTARDQVLTARAPAGAPLGFVPVIRLYEGDRMALGAYAWAAPAAGSVAATLQACTAPNGRLLATTVRTVGGAAAPPTVRLFATPAGNPVATTALGALAVITHGQRGIERGLQQAHPDLRRRHVDVGRLLGM